MSNWEKKRLDNCADVRMGQSPDSSSYNEEEHGLPFLQGCAEFGTKYPTHRIYTSQVTRVAPANSILISVRAPVGTLNFSMQDYCIGRGLGSIKSYYGDLDTWFLYYYIEQNVKRLEKLSQGSTFEAINSNDLKSLVVDLPILSERRKIAKILQTVDGQLEKTEAIIAKYKAIKQGLMQDLFTRGIDVSTGKLRPRHQDAPELYKPSPLGMIPREWEIDNIGNNSFVTKLAGFEYTQYFDYSKSGPIIAVRALNIKNGSLVLDDIHTIPQQTSNSLTRSKLNKGDLVISYVGTLGRVAVIPENNKYHLAPNVAKITVDQNENNPFFLNQYLNSNEGQDEIFKLAASTTQAALSMKNLREVIFKKPTLKEQVKINCSLNTLDNQLDVEIFNLQKLNLIKKGLMSDLISGKVRVQVNEEAVC